MTATTAIIALQPWQWTSVTLLKMHQSFSIAVIGEFIVALSLLLIVLPSLLLLIMKDSNKIEENK